MITVVSLLVVGALGGPAGPDAGADLAMASFDASVDASAESSFAASAETTAEDATEDTASEGVAEASSSAPRPSRRVVAPTIGVQKTEEEKRRGIRGIGVSGTALIASGASIAQGADGANANVSPAMLTVDAGFSHPELPWLEMAPGMMLELERGVSFGVAFRMRAFLLTRRIRPYAMVGLPAFVAPHTLFGAQVAGGVAFKLHRVFAIAAEFGPTVFFAGNDLTEGGVLVKADGALGIRVGF